MQIHIDVLGDVVLEREFLRIGENSRNLAPAFEVIFNAFERWTARQFKTSGSEMETPWPPLEPDTISAKARAGYADPTQPLVATGALAGSLFGGYRGVREIGREEAVWGTRDPVAMFHHGRDRSPENPVPRRPIFELNELRRRWIMLRFQAEIFDAPKPRAPS